MSYIIGLDIGKERDYTAMTIVEPQAEGFIGVHLQRWPLGTSYVDIAKDVARMTTREPLVGNAVLLVDATGIGGPFMDVLMAERPGVTVVALTIGNQAKMRQAGDRWKVGVPKRELVQAFASAVGAGRFKVAQGLPLTPALLQEMQRLQVRIDAKGHAVYAADFEPGTNDDLLLSAMYACWFAEQGRVTA